VLATIRVDYFRHFYSYFELENRDLLALLITDGTALYVRPFPDDVINRNLSASPLFTRELARKDRGNATGFRRSITSSVSLDLRGLNAIHWSWPPVMTNRHSGHAG
jgi:hypothetical protein